MQDATNSSGLLGTYRFWFDRHNGGRKDPQLVAGAGTISSSNALAQAIAAANRRTCDAEVLLGVEVRLKYAPGRW